MTLDHILIGKKIKEFRKRNNLTQEKLAEEVDLSVTYICLVETGIKHISLEKIFQIAYALNVTVDKLIYEACPRGRLGNTDNFIEIISDCSDCELKIIFDTVSSLKKSMKENMR